MSKNNAIADMLNRAVAHHRAGRLDQAARDYAAILKKNPRQADALHLSGLIHAAQNRHQQALALIGKAIQIRPDDPLFHSNLAMASVHAGKPEQAIEAADQALKCNPNTWEAHDHKGVALHHLGRFEEALVSYDQALAQQPKAPPVYNHKGNTLRKCGRQKEAEACYRKALALMPHHPEARQNLAGLLLFEGRADEAEQILAPLQQSRHAHVHNLLGQIHQLQGKTAAARSSYDHAIKLDGSQPLWQFRREAVCPVIAPNTRAISSWRRQFSRGIDKLPQTSLSDVAADLPGSHAEPPFHLAYHGECNKALKQRYAQRFLVEPPDFAPRKEGPPNIGMVVTAGHEGIFLKCTGGILEHWGSSGTNITVIAPAASVAMISQAIHNPKIGYHILGSNPEKAAQDLRQQQFDLIYYWEAGSDATNYFLPFFRPAPVQVISWGTADTTGIPAIDYYIGSRVWEDQSRAPDYSEKLVLLDRAPTCFPRLNFDGKPDRAKFGFAKDEHIYLCAQNLFKIHPDCDQLFKDLLDTDKKARIILVEGKQKAWTELLKARLDRTLSHGMTRITFLNRLNYGDYCTLVKSADVVLDSLHFSGGNTSYETLDLGTPIVTLPGRFIRGRFTLGCYTTMGIEGCIAKNRQDYLEKAIEIASDPCLRQKITEKISDAAPTLFEDQRAARSFEQKLVELSQTPVR